MAIHGTSRLRAPSRAAALGALFVIVAACGATGQPAVGQPTATPPDQAGNSQPTALDGEISYTLDASNSSGGSTNSQHEQLNVMVHLVAGSGPSFVDSGSTFTYSETQMSHDPQTKSSCGLDTTSTGSGSGPFAGAGSISASYGNYSPNAGLHIHVPYENVASLKFLCNGLSQSDTTQETTIPDCSEGGSGELDGTIGPGNVMEIAPGQVIDFACNQVLPIGTSSVTVKGTLTSR